jgi:hypothetical protein
MCPHSKTSRGTLTPGATSFIVSATILRNGHLRDGAFADARPPADARRCASRDCAPDRLTLRPAYQLARTARNSLSRTSRSRPQRAAIPKQRHSTDRVPSRSSQ